LNTAASFLNTPFQIRFQQNDTVAPPILCGTAPLATQYSMILSQYYCNSYDTITIALYSFHNHTTASCTLSSEFGRVGACCHLWDTAREPMSLMTLLASRQSQAITEPPLTSIS